MQNDPRPAAPTLAVAEHCRVVPDNDWSGDPDGLVARAHLVGDLLARLRAHEAAR